jgi:hypothetical protein
MPHKLVTLAGAMSLLARAPFPEGTGLDHHLTSGRRLPLGRDPRDLKVASGVAVSRALALICPKPSHEP